MDGERGMRSMWWEGDGGDDESRVKFEGEWRMVR